MSRSFSELLQQFMESYMPLRESEPCAKDTRLWQLFTDIEQKIESLRPVKARTRLKVCWSGRGNWAMDPWVAILDERETDSPQRGVYCVYLFRRDLSGVYLTLNQGVTDLFNKYSAPEARRILSEKTDSVRPFAQPLLSLGFRTDNSIDLHAGDHPKRDYQASTIAHKFYAEGRVPEDSELEADLEAVLICFDEYIKRETPKRTWCVYVPAPAGANLRLALEQGTWGSENPVSEIRSGDDLIVVHGLSSDLPHPPKGFPRVDDPALFRGTATEVIRAQIDSDGFTDDSTIWTDKVYRNRFRFSVRHRDADAAFNIDLYSRDIVDATRQSCIKQGRPVLASAERAPREQTGLRTDDPPAPRYWVLSAGVKASEWAEWQERGMAALGWDGSGVGDLRQYPDREAIKAALMVGRAPGGAEPVNAALALYQFCREMRVGDIVVAKIGRSRTLGVGSIESDYQWHDERPAFKHVRAVKWLKVRELEMPENARVPLKTLTDVTEFAAFREFIEESYLSSEDEPVRPEDPYTLDDALSTLFVPAEELREILAGLNRKKNIILQGAPGVGKTFAAKLIAFAFMGARSQTRIGMIQFHQSYAYEDFIQGWRPSPEGGFRLRNGNFLEFCNRARIDPTRSYVFIIDEINRGNLSKIFGELMMLIESDKRGAQYAIPLTYAEEPGEAFSVPENVYLIGLMNTADRSLALVDYALRRRFAFYSLKPAFGSATYRATLTERGVSEALIEQICRRLTALNDRIVADRDLGKGFVIGHSFFCPAESPGEYGAEWYRTVIRTDIEPLLREYWFDKKEAELEEIIADLVDGI